MEKAFCYCRQSSGSADADESLSIIVQEEETRKLAAAHSLEVIEVFREPDRSGRLYPTGFEALAAIDKVYLDFTRGTSKENQYRTALGALLKRLDEVQYIICVDMTRLFRPLNGSFLENLVIQQLTQRGVKVWSCREGLVDFTQFQSRLFTSLSSQLASEQLLIQREKSRKGMALLKASGEWNFQCAKSFGYRGTGRKREVEIVPNRAEVVKKVYALWLEGKRYYTISKAVAPLLKDDPKCKVLHKAQMMRMLKNPVYTGYYPLEDGTLTKAKCLEGLEIISFSDWARAQELLRDRAKSPRHEKKNWLPLSGKFFCGYCGSRINAITTNKTNVHMRCMSYAQRAAQSCRNGLTWNTLEPGGAGLLDALFPLSMVWLASQLKAASASREKELDGVLAGLESCKKKLNSLQKMFLDDLLTQDSFEKAASELRTKRKELESRAREIEAEAAAGTSIEEARSMLAKAFAHTMDEGEAELALRKSISKVTIWRERIVAELEGGGQIELPVKRIGKSRELPMPWADFIEKSDGSYQYLVTWSFERLSPEAKARARTLYVHPSGKVVFKVV